MKKYVITVLSLFFSSSALAMYTFTANPGAKPIEHRAEETQDQFLKLIYECLIASTRESFNESFNALKNYKLALKHDPQDEYALESAMMCYGEMTRHAEAEEFLQNSMQRIADACKKLK